MAAKLSSGQQIEKLLRREEALAIFGSFAFHQTDLQVVLEEAASVCATCLEAPFSKICRYRPAENDLLVVAGHGWSEGVVGHAISVADRTSPQGLAFETGEPQVCANIGQANTYTLPSFYKLHGVVSTADVLVAAEGSQPFGVLEVDSRLSSAFDEHDINFLSCFANVLAVAVATAARAQVLQQALSKMEALVDEKETLSQELRHRVRNSLHLIYGLLLTELEAKHDPASSNIAFRSIALRVIGLAEVFDHLLGVGMNKFVNLGDYVEALCFRLPELYNESRIEILCTADPVKIPLDMATPLGIVVTELVNNAYLHAFPHGGTGEIAVKLRASPDQLVLSVSDNGIGFVETETRRRGIGLVRRLVGQVGGSLTHQSGNGTVWTVEVASQEFNTSTDVPALLNALPL